jgi:hypothetical protein
MAAVAAGNDKINAAGGVMFWQQNEMKKKDVERHAGIFVGVEDPPAAFSGALHKSGFIPTEVRSIKRSMTYADADHALGKFFSLSFFRSFSLISIYDSSRNNGCIHSGLP